MRDIAEAFFVLGVVTNVILVGVILFLDQISGQLQQLLKLRKEQVAKIDDLLAGVQAEKTLVESVGKFIQNLKEQLAACGLDDAKVAQIFDVVEANKAALSAALEANTPVLPETPPTGPVA